MSQKRWILHLQRWLDGCTLWRCLPGRYNYGNAASQWICFSMNFFKFFFTGFFGKHCMDFCSCPSPQFVCHAAHGCVCRVGFSGTDCLTPKGQFQELHNGKIDCHFIVNVPYLSSIRFCFFFFSTGQSSAGIAWGIIVALGLVAVIIFISLYFRRRVRNLKTEIAHVQYIADPPSQPDRHHFDNPVYAFQPSTSGNSDSSTLLNNLRTSHKPSNLSSRGTHYAHIFLFEISFFFLE